MTERLDRIEATLASIAELMATGRREHDAQMAAMREQHDAQMAAMREQHNAQMARHDAQIANINKIVESNARAIEANSNALAEYRRLSEANTVEVAQQRAELRSSIEDTVAMISTMAAQAESDRIEFRAYVQSILDALTTRFNSNGHSD
jgi:hypothetical protein